MRIYMKTLISALLLIAPALVCAKTPQAADQYSGLVSDLLKGCSGDRKIAVANFAYEDGRASGDGEVVSARLTTELVKLKKFRVAERKEIEKVFAELKLQRSGAMDAGSVKDAGKLLGADWMVLGTLTELSSGRIEVNARLVSVESGEIINASAARVKKDWRDKPARGEAGENEIKKNPELDEYDKAILKYMNEKAGEKKNVVKEPPSF